MDDQQQRQHHQPPPPPAPAPAASSFPASSHHHQRRRSALEGPGGVVLSTSPLVVGPGGLALLNLGATAASSSSSSPARLRGGSGSGIDGPLGGSSPLSSYALRVMRERAAGAAGGSGEEKGDWSGPSSPSAAASLSSSTATTTTTTPRRGSSSGGYGGPLSSLSYASSPTQQQTSPSPAAKGAVIRSVDDDDDDDEVEEGQRRQGGCCAGPQQHHHHHGPTNEEAAPSVTVAGTGGGGSSSSNSASMCCRNCGSSEVVKKVPLSASSPTKAEPSSSVNTNTTAALRAASLASGLPVSTCKLLVVGNAKCGKTSVIRRFVQGSFENAYVSTVGADYLKRDVVLKDGRPVRLQLWDIAGQDRFVHLTRAYFARAKGVLLVCDLTREKTFEAVRAWKREIDEWARTETVVSAGATGEDGGQEGTALPVVLIANKCDMLTDAADSFLAGANMVAMCHEQNFASWYVTSARTGSNVEAAFLDLVERAVAFMDEQERARAAAQAAAGGGGGANGSSGFKLSSADGGPKAGAGAGGSLWSMC